MKTNPDEKNSLVYTITVQPTKKFYIGSTCDIYRRLRDHFNGKQGSNPYVANAVLKHGLDNILVNIIQDGMTREEAYLLEQQLLNFHFKDPLNMNFSNKAKGNNSEFNSKPRGERKCLEEFNPDKLNLNFISRKVIRQKFPLNKQPSEMTTREFKEWYKDNKPFTYALRSPSNEIILLRKHSLSLFCKNHSIDISKLYVKGYCNNWFFTKDLSTKGIEKLKSRKYKVNKGNSKKYKIYLNNIFVEITENLTEWCKLNNVNIATARIYCRKNKSIKGYTFIKIEK